MLLASSWLASPAISFDEIRARVGREFYGDAFIDPITDDEWELIQRYGPEKERASGAEIIGLCPANLQEALYRALGRWHVAKAQIGTVDRWLEEYGFFDRVTPPFSRKEFEAALAGPMGDAIKEVRAKLRAKFLAATEPAADAPAQVAPESLAETIQTAVRRRGPAPGTVDRHGKSDRTLFPEIERLLGQGKTVTAATRELAETGRLLAPAHPTAGLRGWPTSIANSLKPAETFSN